MAGVGRPVVLPHPQRKEIARYLLARGLDPETLAPSAAVLGVAARAAPRTIAFPDGLAPVPVAPPAGVDPAAPLPAADVVVVTWTVDELAGLAKVFSPGHSASRWSRYTHNFDVFAALIRAGAPAATSKRLGSYQLVTRRRSGGVVCQVGAAPEPGRHQDRRRDRDVAGEGPVPADHRRDRPSHVFTIGTAGSVFDDFQLGDVVVTRAARFRCQREFRNEPFNNQTFSSDWQIPLTHLAEAEELMAGFAGEVVEPPFAPPTTRFPFPGPPIVARRRTSPTSSWSSGAVTCPSSIRS